MSDLRVSLWTFEPSRQSLRDVISGRQSRGHEKIIGDTGLVMMVRWVVGEKKDQGEEIVD
jgi:hypothetical protein